MQRRDFSFTRRDLLSTLAGAPLALAAPAPCGRTPRAPPRPA